jgi:hypothetical protein
MRVEKSGGILRFIWVGILFGGAGFCALTFLVVTNPRWFALYWRVVRFFATLPFSYLRMNQDSV